MGKALKMLEKCYRIHTDVANNEHSEIIQILKDEVSGVNSFTEFENVMDMEMDYIEANYMGGE